MRLRWLPALVTVVAVGLLSTASSGCKKSTTVEGPSGKQLTLSVPDTVTIDAGGTETMKVSVSRENTDQAIDISVDNLPEGVKVRDSKIHLDKGQKDVEVILEADEKAKLVENHAVKVKGSAGELSATETVKITVREKKS